MLFSDAKAAIRSRIETQWVAQYPTYPLIFGNDEAPTFDEAPRVCKVEIRGGIEKPVAFGGIGSNRYRKTGEVIFRILGPSDEGEATVDPIADFAASILRGWQDGDLKFYASSVLGGDEEQKDGNYYQFDVMSNFTFDLIQ
jgi:hypothetical protein